MASVPSDSEDPTDTKWEPNPKIDSAPFWLLQPDCSIPVTPA